jgi:5-methylcytosine-specific restriction endonuclease McrA
MTQVTKLSRNPRRPKNRTPKRNQGSHWCRPSTRLSVYNRDRLRCHLCGCITDGAPGEDTAPTLDHIVAVKTRGGKISSNPLGIVVACHDCNSVRRDRQLTPSELRHAVSLATQPLDRKVGRQLLKGNKWPQALAELTARYQGTGSTTTDLYGGGHFPR